MAMTDQGARVELESQERSGATPRRRRTRTYVAVGVAAVLVIGGGGAVTYLRWDSAQEQLLTTAQAGYDSARADHAAALTEARTALEGITHDDLHGLLELEVEQAAVNDVSAEGSRSERAAALEGAAETVRSSAASLRAKTEETVAAQHAWELEQARAGYGQAGSDLAAAIDAASAVLSASEGRVLDEATRVALAEALTAATALRDQPPAEDASLEKLTAAAAAASETTSTLPTVAQAVVDQQAAWQAEQDRIAGEQAARAAAEQAAKARSAAAQQPRSSTSKGSSSQPSTSGSKSSPSSSGGTRSSSSASAPAPPRQPAPQEETYCITTDESGGSWTGC